MILPIRTLFGRGGGAGGGVPIELTGPPGAVRFDLTGAPAGIDVSGGAADRAADEVAAAAGLILYTGGQHGANESQWNGGRESAFDSWRRQGRPRSGGRCGVGEWAGPDSTLEQIALIGAETAQRILTPEGTLVQRGPGGDLIYRQPGGGGNLPVVGGLVSLQATGNTSGAAILFGGAVAVLGVVWLVARRK